MNFRLTKTCNRSVGCLARFNLQEFPQLQRQRRKSNAVGDCSGRSSACPANCGAGGTSGEFTAPMRRQRMTRCRELGSWERI